MAVLAFIFVFMVKDGLQVGDKVPEFTLEDHNGNELAIMDYVGPGPLVIYFYPKDDTPGCTREACSFRDQFAEFEDFGATIFGISADSPSSHRNFKAKYNLPYTLLSDQGKEVQKLFGVKKNFLGLVDGRSTYVIDKKGVIVHIFNSQFQPKKHISESLEILKQLN